MWRSWRHRGFLEVRSGPETTGAYLGKITEKVCCILASGFPMRKMHRLYLKGPGKDDKKSAWI